MKKISVLLLLVGLLALAVGCGDDDGDSPSAVASEEDAAMEEEDAAMAKGDEAMKGDEGAMAEEGAAMEKEGGGGATTVLLDASEFGQMIYDASDQAIYVFERDTSDESTCYGECAAAWPPVLTKGDPIAGKGLDQSLLGTTKRRDGTTQVTYGDRPLYYYAHEAPGEVRCHNVDMNGGLWWVVGADGEPLA